jgi:fructose-bisphosphate aldolase, class II
MIPRLNFMGQGPTSGSSKSALFVVSSWKRLNQMPLVSMRQLLDEAAKGGYGVGAFNVNNMEQIQAIMEAARETKSPVIVQASRGARTYTNDRFLYHLMVAATEIYPEIPIALHQDHGNSPATCKSAIEMGFTSVMMDGSLMDDGKTPSSFDYNVKVTREVVEMAHEVGVTAEGELGCLGGIEDGHGPDADPLAHLTDPDQAVEFVERTGIDALAVGIGISHGAYRFTKKTPGELLMLERIEAIHKKLPNMHIGVHPSSRLRQDLQDVLNDYLGKMKRNYGVPIEEIQRGITHGVRKINVDIIEFGGGREAECGGLKTDRRELVKAIARCMELFGQAGNAPTIKPITLTDMAKRYQRSRELGQFQKRSKRVFVLHAHDDKNVSATQENHPSVLHRQGEIADWLFGQDEGREIRRHRESLDSVLFLDPQCLAERHPGLSSSSELRDRIDGTGAQRLRRKHVGKKDRKEHDWTHLDTIERFVTSPIRGVIEMYERCGRAFATFYLTLVLAVGLCALWMAETFILKIVTLFLGFWVWGARAPRNSSGPPNNWQSTARVNFVTASID